MASAPVNVTYYRKDTSHGIHLFLSIITCGVWAVTGWPFFIALNTLARRKAVTKQR